jgi:hypothetical protein
LFLVDVKDIPEQYPAMGACLLERDLPPLQEPDERRAADTK